MCADTSCKIIVAFEPHGPAQELDDGIERARHAHAVDGAAHRPIGPFQDALDADHDVESGAGMGAGFLAFEGGEK